MNTSIRLCKLALSGDIQWALEDFNDDSALDIIDPKLKQRINEGKKLNLSDTVKLFSYMI